MGELSREQLEEDIAFLLARAGEAGSVHFTSDRWTGSSSNALVSLAYGGKQGAMPHDRGDYAACVRTYVRLPKHRKTPAVRRGLMKARVHYLAKYPDDATAASRNAAAAKRRAERDEQIKQRPRAKRRARA